MYFITASGFHRFGSSSRTSSTAALMAVQQCFMSWQNAKPSRRAIGVWLVRNCGADAGRLRRLVGCLSYLDQILTRLEELKGLSQVGREDPLQVQFRGIPASEPDYNRRRSLPNHHLREIAVFGQDNRLCLSSPSEYLGVVGITQPKISDRNRIAPEALTNPFGEPRWQVGIEPDHAAITGWSIP
jgi:hypothetical protein